MISTLNDEMFTSIALTSFLIAKIFNDTRLLSFLSEIQQKLTFPRSLLWDGSMYFPNHKNEFIFYDLSDYVSGLGVDNTNIEKGDTVLISPDYREFNSHGVENIEFISIQKEMNTINMLIKLTSTPTSTSDDAFELNYESEGKVRVTCTFDYIDGEIRVNENFDKLEIKINNEDVGYSVSINNIPLYTNQRMQKNGMGLILRVTRWGNGPLSNLIPVNLSI